MAGVVSVNERRRLVSAYQLCLMKISTHLHRAPILSHHKSDLHERAQFHGER